MPKTTKESKLTIAFSATLKHSEISLAFYKFLERENSVTNWEFILATHVLTSHIEKKHHNKAVEHIKYIMNTFFQKEIKPLQIYSEDEKLIILEIKSAWKNQKLAEVVTYLEQLKELLLDKYKNFQFQKFLLEDTTEKFIKKFIKDKKTIIPALAQQFDYKNEDFEMNKISEKDYAFFVHLSEEKLITEVLFKNRKYSVWRMDHHYFPNVTFLSSTNMFRIEYDLDYSMEQAAFVIYSNILEGDRFSNYFEILDWKMYESFTIEQHLTLPGMPPYVRKSIYTMSYDENMIRMCCKPIRIDNMDFQKPTLYDVVTSRGTNPKRMKAVQEFFFISVELIKVDEKRCKHVVNLAVNLLPKPWIVKQAVKIVFSEVYNQNLVKLQALDGSETLYDFGEKFKNEDDWRRDPIAKLLYDLYVQKHGENNKLRVKTEKKSNTNDFVIANIFEMIQPTNDPNKLNIDHQILNNIKENIKQQSISNDQEQANSEFKSNFQFQENNLDLKKESNLPVESLPVSSNFSFLSDHDSGTLLSNTELDFKMDSFEDLDVFQPFSEIDDLIAFIQNEKNENETDIELF